MAVRRMKHYQVAPIVGRCWQNTHASVGAFGIV
nr:MAG TPA: hypothetical protein [Caudoviricetes sp.]